MTTINDILEARRDVDRAANSYLFPNPLPVGIAAIIIYTVICIVCFAQTPTPYPPITSSQNDVYDTRKVTAAETIVLCDTTAYIYSLCISVNRIGETGGRIIIRNRQGNSILNRELTTASGFMTFADGLPMNDGIEIENNADNCDVDIMIDYRK